MRSRAADDVELQVESGAEEHFRIGSSTEYAAEIHLAQKEIPVLMGEELDRLADPKSPVASQGFGSS